MCVFKWYRHVSRSSGLAKTILKGTVKGEEDKADGRKRWEDNIKEWTGLEFAKSRRAEENRKMEETGCEVNCGAPTTPAFKEEVKVSACFHDIVHYAFSDRQVDTGSLM